MSRQHDLTEGDLAQFTGSEQWHRHGINLNVIYTDGVEYMAEHGGAYWLIDEVAINQMVRRVKAEAFQVWILRVNPEKRSAVLTCDDGNGRVVFTKEIEYTDFPLDEMKLYFTDGTILLPSEY